MQHIKTTSVINAETTIIPNTLVMSQLKIGRMYENMRASGLTDKEFEQDYPDFINDLWDSVLKHEDHKGDSRRIQDILGRGDVIQILSDIYIEDMQSSRSN